MERLYVGLNDTVELIEESGKPVVMSNDAHTITFEASRVVCISANLYADFHRWLGTKGRPIPWWKRAVRLLRTAW